MTDLTNMRVTIVATDKSEWYYNFKHPTSYDTAISEALQNFTVHTQRPNVGLPEGNWQKIVITFND